MYRGINVLTLLPDRHGRGGTKFGYHAFQQEPINDTRETLNVHAWQDSWRTDCKSTSALGYLPEYLFPDTNPKAGGSISCLALHGYCKYNTSDPSAGPMTEILGHNVSNPAFSDGLGYVWNYTSYTDYTYSFGGGTVTITWDRNIVCDASRTFPAVFVNIGSRCFIATGINECQIYDSSSGNDVFGNGSGQPHTYDLGVDAPAAAPVVTAAEVVTQTEAWAHLTSIYLSHPDPNSGLSTAVSPGADTLELTADGITWSGATGFDIVSKTTTFSTAAMTVSIENGSNIAYFDGAIPGSNEWTMLTLTVDGKSFIITRMGNGTPYEVPPLAVNAARLDKPYRARRNPHDPSDPLAPEWNPEDDIVDQPFSITGVRWTMQRGGVDLPWPGGLTLGVNMLGQLLNTGGRLTWDETPPSYAYAWYDPVSGHVSNISPVFSPDATSVTDVGIAVPVDVGSISYPSDPTHVPRNQGYGNPFPRWTHILFFRTLMSGGSTLYPIGSLQPFVFNPSDPTNPSYNPEWRGLPNPLAYPTMSYPAVGSGNFWYDTSRDSDLLVSGALRAPQFTNGKPTYTNEGETIVLYPAHMAYWDGRLWMAATQDPAAIHYSCDRVQCPFGVPEESFPPTNVLRIPASDGAVRGMKLIGEHLLITTERWAYTIAGNNESNYRLVRISTRMAGVGDYQMDEFVSDVEGQAALVVFFGTDSKVYAMPLGGQAVHISKDIQTYLSSVDRGYRPEYIKSQVHCMSVDGRRMLLLYVAGPFPDVFGKTFIYDFDQKVWTEHKLSSDSSELNTGYRTAWGTIPSVLTSGAEVYSIPNMDITGITSPTVGAKLRRWFQNATTPMTAGYVKTFPLNFDGQKTRKRLHFVRIFVNDESPTTVVGGQTYYGWRITVRPDSSSTTYFASPTQEYDTAYRQLRSGGVPVDSANDAELIVTDAALYPDAPLLGYTFEVTVTAPEHTDKLFRLYRVEIGWSVASEGQVDL